MNLKNLALAACPFVFCTPAGAADVLVPKELAFLPAVSQPNGKIETGYADYRFDRGNGAGLESGQGYFVQGAFSFPVAERFGVQIDAGFQRTDIELGGGVTSSDGDVRSWGIGGHFFWRDPSRALVGVYGHFVRHDVSIAPFSFDVDAAKIALETEFYSGAWTFKALVGIDHADFGQFGGTTTAFAGRAEANFYVTENFMATLGVDHSFDQTFATVGFEAQFSQNAVAPTVFAKAAFGDDAHTILAGLKLHFGASGKSLQTRHREDDPDIDLFRNFGAVVGACNSAAAPQSSPTNSRVAVVVGPPSQTISRSNGCGGTVTTTSGSSSNL